MSFQRIKSPLCILACPTARSELLSFLRPPTRRYVSRGRLGPKMRAGVRDETRFPNDLGLLADTFVMPRQPSLFSSPVLRGRLYWHRIVKFGQAIILMNSYKWASTKPRPKIAWMDMRKQAQDLHKRLFTALAMGDDATLKEICCEGLYKDLQQRIVKQESQQRWTRHKVGIPRVVSTRVAKLPYPNSALRQHVVKIRSVQSLDTLLKKGETASEDQYIAGEKKRMVEYFVLQRRYLKGVEGPWLLWGTVEETEASRVLQDTSRKGPVPIIEVAKA